MDDFDPHRNETPVEYAVRTGDPSEGASVNDGYRRLPEDNCQDIYETSPTVSVFEIGFGALIAAILLLVGLASW